MKTILLLFTTIVLYGQEESTFIDRAYEYAMKAEGRIDELEKKNNMLHCEIHDYIVQENMMREKIDSLHMEVEYHKMLQNENFSIFTSLFVLFFIALVMLLMILMRKKS